MSWIDLVFTVIFVWSIYKGFTKGFIIAVASLCALIIGVFGAIQFSGYMAKILAAKFEFNPENIKLIAFIITFVLIVIATHLIAFLTDKLIKAIALGFINRLAGALFNLIKSALIISVFLIIIERIDEKVPFIPKSEVEKSSLYTPLHSLAPVIFPYLRSGYDKLKKNFPLPDEIIACKNKFQ